MVNYLNRIEYNYLIDHVIFYDIFVVLEQNLFNINLF